jgi:hypothetical protein
VSAHVGFGGNWIDGVLLSCVYEVCLEDEEVLVVGGEAYLYSIIAMRG